MNDLKLFVALQNRLYEFLGQQDEATVLAIVDGTAQLAVLRAGDVRTPIGSAPREDPVVPPSSDPLRAAHDLSRLPSKDDRRIYLNAAGFTLSGLRVLAKADGLRGYSKLTKAELIDQLAGHHPARIGSPAGEPGQAGRRETRSVAPSTETTTPGVDAAGIATHLRETETEDEGAVYLRARNLDRAGLLAVAAELQLTRVDRLSRKELERRVLKQAIGARRKFAGLRSW